MTERVIEKPPSRDTSENNWWWFTQENRRIMLLEVVGTLPVLDYDDPKDGAIPEENLPNHLSSVGCSPPRVLFVSDNEDFLRRARALGYKGVAIKPADNGDFYSAPKCGSIINVVNAIEWDPRFP